MNLIETIEAESKENLTPKYRKAIIKRIALKTRIAAPTGIGGSEAVLATALAPHLGFLSSYTVPTDKKFQMVSGMIVCKEIVADGDIEVVVRGGYMDSAIALTNSVKTVWNTHNADATEHTAGLLPAIAVADCTDLTTMIALITALLASYALSDADAELGAAWEYHIAQEAGDASLASEAAPTTMAECKTRINDYRTKMNTHVADSTCHTSGDSGVETQAVAATTDSKASIIHGDSGGVVAVQQETDLLGNSAPLLEGEPLSIKIINMASVLKLANNLKETWNIHMANAANHTSGIQTAITAADAFDEVSLLALATALIASYEISDADSEDTTPWLYHDAQETGDASLASAVAPTTVAETITKLTDFETKMDTHIADATAHAGSDTVSPSDDVCTVDSTMVVEVRIKGIEYTE